LERELAEAVSRSQLADFRASDIRWRWPTLKICLPQQLLSIQQGDALRWLTHFDVTKSDVDSAIRCPEAIAQEIDEFGARIWKQSKAWRLERLECRFEKTTSYIVSAALNRSQADRQEIYTLIIKTEDSPGSSAHNEEERLLSRLEHLVWNVLVFLSLAAIEYEPAERIVRKARGEGEHQIAELTHAHFVGEFAYRAVRHRSSTKPSVDSPASQLASARHLAPNWLCGHWRRVVYGSGGSARRLQWIMTYHTGEME
jgi:hypothetical protein